MEKIKLTGLWKNTDKSGNTYYAGNLSPTVRLLIFKNDFKQGERDPDLVVYLVPAERKRPFGGDTEDTSHSTDDVPF